MSAALATGTWLLQAALLGALLLGIRRGNAALGANALLALAATFIPSAVAHGLAGSHGVQVSIDGVVPFWIATAGFLHVLGMWRLYEFRRGWDHVTHVVSAALVAAVVSGTLHGIALASPTLRGSAALVDGITLLFTLALGVFWELVELVVHRYSEELGVEAVLVPYGRRDAVLDLLFDVVGATAVLWFDVRVLESVAEAAPSLARWALLCAGGVVVFGSLVSALLLAKRPAGRGG